MVYGDAAPEPLNFICSYKFDNITPKMKILTTVIRTNALLHFFQLDIELLQQ